MKLINISYHNKNISDFLLLLRTIFIPTLVIIDKHDFNNSYNIRIHMKNDWKAYCKKYLKYKKKYLKLKKVELFNN